MSNDGFIIEGLDELHKKMLNLAKKEFPDFCEAAAEALSMQLMKRVAELAPVDEQRLRSSFEMAAGGFVNDDAVFEKSKKGAGIEILAGSNVEYADYVNTGHKLRDGSWWEGYHYFDDAYDELEAQAAKWLADRLDELFGEVF